MHNGNATGLEPGTPYTGWTNDQATMRLDMFFMSPYLQPVKLEHIDWRNCLPCRLQVDSPERLHCSPSDHLPVYVDVALPGH